ncbi:hypothetical protein CRE_24405 [Caenorhabditis remanei]|uniref:Uncharacterized protein n=1 Tax=Caenorhabditis remanei TaxID=31234 RepID=E3MFU0_CAERE|nr:hypothetical protein CRE_24405 [Caenorhabditis remanei]
MAVERVRLEKKEQKRINWEIKKRAKESLKSPGDVEVKKEMVEEGGTIRKSLSERVTFPKRNEEKEKMSESRSKKRKSDEMTSEHRKEKTQKLSKKKQKERKQADNCDEPKKKMKKRDEEGQKSFQRDSLVVNTGGPTGNQSRNAPFQQAPALNGGGGGGGMNLGSAGFRGGQGQFGGYGGGGPQFGNGNPMDLFSFHGNRQFIEQSASEVMQATRLLSATVAQH